MIEIPRGIAINPANLRNTLSKFGQGAFYAYNTASQAINASSVTQVTLATEVLDVNSWLASNVYTPKQPGYYLFFAQVYATVDADFTDDTSAINIYIRKNAATPAYKAQSRKSAVTLTTFAILEANGTTDYFDVAVFHNAGGAMDIDDAGFAGVFVSFNNP